MLFSDLERLKINFSYQKLLSKNYYYLELLHILHRKLH